MASVAQHGGGICLVAALRLAYLQIWRYEELNAQAESNRTAIVPIVPNRGVIMDRNGIVLATNYSGLYLGDHTLQSDAAPGRPD